MSFPPALPLRLVIFDCDGVIVDSEPPSNRTLAAEISRLGWAVDEAECTRLFVGHTLEQVGDTVAERLGAVPEGWVEHVRRQIIAVLAREVTLVPGVRKALDDAASLGLKVRVASNSSHAEMRAKFGRTGLETLLERAHSADDVGAGKPAPDVFLAAAAAEDVPPGACLVIEDSVPGVTAARAAEMAVLGFAPHGDGAALRAAGATVIGTLDELPSRFRAAMRLAA